MSDSTRSILHEVMEQQTVSIAKAGIICTLNARTSVLASANPVESRYNPSLSIVENLNLPPTLLSRMDLIFLMLDNVNAENDRKLAKHLLNLYLKPAEREALMAERMGAGNGEEDTQTRCVCVCVLVCVRAEEGFLRLAHVRIIINIS